VPRAERREMTTLSREQVERLLAATVADRDHAIYVLAVTTGLRQGELLGLRWSDVDFDAGRLAVQRSLQRQQGKGLVFVEPKTARSRRSVTLSQRAVAALRDHRVRQLEERLALGSEWQDVSLVFPNLTGGPMDGPTLTGRFKAALVLAGLPVIRFHDLRHSAATLLLEEGIHPKVVQELLGHSTITLTLDTYSHVTATMHDQAATTMDRLFGS
ncbi:MAG TPA: site-specific integrase, partial [Thermomicrobiales bacterium]|nr:site-specific integrase [Thermomicrobiales bacterium]